MDAHESLSLLERAVHYRVRNLSWQQAAQQLAMDATELYVTATRDPEYRHLYAATRKRVWVDLWGESVQMLRGRAAVPDRPAEDAGGRRSAQGLWQPLPPPGQTETPE